MITAGHIAHRPLILLIAVMVCELDTWAGETNYASTAEFRSNLLGLHHLTAITAAYRKEALRLILAEANSVAEQLHLQEDLPITEASLVSSYVAPPRLAQRLGAIGNLTTTNYAYYISVGNKFSFLTRRALEQEYSQLRKQCLQPMSQMETNAAYQLATQWLSEASMDVNALGKDCNVHILAFTPEGEKGQHFVPIYWVYWSLRGREGQGSVASVELFEPKKTLRQLRVEESRYILRRPLQFTNLDALLAEPK